MIDPIVFDDVPLFKLLDEEEKKVLAQQVSMRDFKKGQRLFKTGDPGGVSYIIQKGLVHVSIQDANKETIVIDIADKGGLVGMSSLLAEENHLTTAIAVEDTTAIELDRSDIVALVTSKPLAGLDMMTIVEKHLREAHNLMRTRVARNLNEEMEEQETLGEKAADAVARFGGSWVFVTSFGVVLVIYVTINSILPEPRKWDPYPFILLNLFLSMLAAVQAPIIMMSQNRQDAKDRARSELDYRVNLKAEVEIEELLQKVGKIEERIAEILPEQEKRE